MSPIALFLGLIRAALTTALHAADTHAVDALDAWPNEHDHHNPEPSPLYDRLVCERIEENEGWK